MTDENTARAATLRSKLSSARARRALLDPPSGICLTIEQAAHRDALDNEIRDLEWAISEVEGRALTGDGNPRP